jgi:DNA primase
MRCPFNGPDRNPSGSVNTIEGVYHCFSCDVAGDGYAIIMQREGMSFVEAVEFASGILGISGEAVPQGNGRQPRRKVSFDEPEPVEGQRSIFQAGVRRRPFAGS